MPHLENQSTERNAKDDPGPLAELRGPMLGVCLAVMLGITLGRGLDWLWLWIVLALVPFGGMLVMWRRGSDRGVRAWGVLCLLALSAAWLIVRADYSGGGGGGLAAYIGESSQLARVVGEVIEPPATGSPARGAFAGFNYEDPSTRFMLRVEQIEVDDEWVDARGDLMLRIDEADYRLESGQVIEAVGWLGAVAGPSNVGEFDYRDYLTERGIVGRLTLRNRGNWTLLEERRPGIDGFQRALRQTCADHALQSLRLGMDDDTPTLGLLETMLLGRKDSSSSEVRIAFRQVGLAHLLSISGAHLGILMGLVWMIARFFVPYPPRAAMIVLAVLALYLLAVPLRVPIVRSGIMAGVFCAAYATGRQVRPFQVLAFAAVVVLLWRPMDLFSPGFQLSFAAVGGLILFVQPVSDWLWPRPEVLPGHQSISWVIGRWCVDYLSVSLVAFAVVAPLVAYHFQMVNPLAVLLSVMALPVITAVLGVGYFKILVGVLLPSAGIILSGPLDWLGDTLRGLVDHAGDWPGTSFLLTWRPSVGWTFAMSVLVIAVLAGAFAQRRRALVSAVLVMALWTGVTQTGKVDSWFGPKQKDEPAALLTMFAVGDGSCYLLQLPGHTLMFDCGSQQYFDIAQSSILPALKRMGVTRIDTLILSHADMDHYGGALDLADEIAVGRVFVPPQLIAEAEAHPGTATAFLIDGLNDHRLTPQPVTRSWSETIGDAELQILWPPTDLELRHANDTSIVLSVRTAGRRILLNGDIQDEAITGLLESEELAADITDLPHHGGVVDSSAAWLHAVNPTVILQSCGRTKLYQDRWSAILEDSNATRLMTARDRMSQVFVGVDGAIKTWKMRGEMNGRE
ncbi:MAG: DNA internalization-related competence protein ComEC/Rec2 [Phycisphaerales bacterium]